MSCPGRPLVAALVFVLAGCAQSSVGVDAGPAPADADVEPDSGPRADAAPPPDAAPPADAACELGTVENCSDCGDVCPYQGTTGATVVCEAMTCEFRCAGEAYDVNGDPSDGCELDDSPTGNHTTGGAIDLGSMPCDDGDSNPAISGVMISDGRVHDPPIQIFRPSSGSAPDYYKLFASGGLCVNEVDLDLVVSGSSSPSGCYRLNVVTSVATYQCTTSASGSCGIDRGMSSYQDNTNIIIQVEKLCPISTVTERVTYTVTGHF